MSSESSVDAANRLLIHAAASGDVAAIRQALDKGADPNHIVDIGGPVIKAAVYSGSIEAVEILLAAGADINVPDGQGETALMLAVRRGEDELVAPLIRHGANLDHQDSFGLTALMLAIPKNPTIVDLLVRAGADTMLVNRLGSSALHDAIHMNDLTIVESCVDIHAPDSGRETPLMLATEKGFDTIAERLIHAHRRASTPPPTE